MSKEHPRIIYVGDDVRGQALRIAVQSRGWRVYLPTERLQALGMYAVYFPDIVVLEAVSGSNLAEEVCFHLRTVRVEPLLILTDELQHEQWNVSAMSAIHVLPRTASIDDLIAAILELIESSKELVTCE
ncbi:MAG: hypothetical protein ACE5I2_00740 [Anaerolineae bacterium]